MMAGNQAGAKLRLAVEVVDASSGAQLWAETINSRSVPETVFELRVGFGLVEP